MRLNRLDSSNRGCRVDTRDSRVGRGRVLERTAIAGDSPVLEPESDIFDT